jgi:hypothetical protein
MGKEKEKTENWNATWTVSKRAHPVELPAAHICSNEVNYFEVKRASWCHVASLYNMNTVQGIVCDERTVKREHDELGKQKLLSLSYALVFSRMCTLFTMTVDNVQAKWHPHLTIKP